MIIFAVFAIMAVSTNQLYGTMKLIKDMEWLLKKQKRQTPQEGFAYIKNDINF